VKVLNLNEQMKSVMTVVRDSTTNREDFVFYADRLVRFVVEEGLSLCPYKEVKIKTNTDSEYTGLNFGSPICGVSIVRAGESMEAALLQCCRSVRIGKILIQRNEETAEPVLMYSKLPQDIHKRTVMLLDPMLATGGSAMTAIKVLLDNHVPQNQIIFVNLISCPEGLDALTTKYPEVKIVTAECDTHLNEKKYIIPGCGDFGDRYFGTDKFDYVRPT
jgi:uracil phosphoribosyltransferase